MVKLYGLIKRTGYAVGDTFDKILISTGPAHGAALIMEIYADFIKQYNANHITPIHGLIFETDDGSGGGERR